MGPELCLLPGNQASNMVEISFQQHVLTQGVSKYEKILEMKKKILLVLWP